MLKVVDPLMMALCCIISILLVTGGFSWESTGLKAELAQIDAFAWGLFALSILRRYFTGEWFPRDIERWAERIVAAIEKRPMFALWMGISVYVALYAGLSARRFDSFHANAFDLGYIDQALWSTTRAGFLHSDLSRGGSYLGEHFSPVLGAVSLLYRLWDSVYALFIFQSFIFGMSSFLVYGLARKQGFSKGSAVILGACLLLYQPLRLANEFDFREDNLFVPVFLGALLSLESRAWLRFWGLMICSWAIKENAALFTFLIGAWLIYDSRRADSPDARSIAPRAGSVALLLNGAILSILSAFVFIFINAKVTPFFSGSAERTMLVQRLPGLGSSNVEVLKTLILKPWIAFSAMGASFLQKTVLRYFLQVFAPFLLLFFIATAFGKSRKPRTHRMTPAFAIAIIGFCCNVLMNVTSIGFHYECVFVPFLFYSLVRGLACQFDSSRPAPASLEQRSLHPSLVIVVVLGFLLFYGRSPLFALRRYAPTKRDRFVAEQLKLIPPEASVSTQSALFPHLSHRSRIEMIQARNSTDYIVVDLARHLSRYANPDLELKIRMIDEMVYEKSALDQGRLIVWRRR